ncbi:discoidin, CUB and LCCL domain-containing protein 1 [Synchiropus picturatus]
MLAMDSNIEDAVKSLAVAFWITYGIFSGHVSGQEGDGCGHTQFGTDSGTLASRNFPGTYPSNSWCRWKLRVPEGRTLLLLFGDFDIESSAACSNGSLSITDKNGEVRLGPVCGKLTQKNLSLPSNEATVAFRSGQHRSGRGFLLSYTTDQHPDLISCLQRGSHFTAQRISVYCPAGCQKISGDVWGSSEQGYRDTSVLCKSAVHAGSTSDALGGAVTLSREKSLRFYESTYANGILSKVKSLSEKKLVFHQECNDILRIFTSNASSSWQPTSRSLGNMDVARESVQWTSAGDDSRPWVELGLTDRSSVTGVITAGSEELFLRSYSLQFSKDRRNWKVYRGALSKDTKVFPAHTEGHLRVRNNLLPPVVARFIRLQPLTWRGQASAQIQVLGCPIAKVTSKTRSAEDSPPVRFGFDTAHPSSSPPPTTESPILVETRSRSGQPVMLAVGVVLGLIMCGTCLLAGVWWKRRKKEAQIKYSLPTSCQSFQVKSLPCPPELISYPLERNIHDSLPAPPLNDYAEPALGQKLGSTFRPSSEEAYTVPYAFNQYDTPSAVPEYAEPLPAEPEYATPFSEPDSAPPAGLLHTGTSQLPAQGCGHADYDCPSHRMLSNGYCTPAIHAHNTRPDSVVYAEPKSCDGVTQKHL